MFRRRFMVVAAMASALFLGACSQAIPEKISIPQARLEQGLAKHFPKRFPVAGLLQLDMQTPALQLLPADNRLQTLLQVQLSGPALAQTFAGEMQVRFALRYEPKDQTVRAHHVEVLSLRLDGASPAIADMVDTYGARLAAQALEAFALYRVPDEELALAHQLNLQPGQITVTAEGLDVAIDRKPASGTVAPATR